MTSDYNYRRVAGAAGIIAMALLVVGFLMPGSPPKADDSVQAISNFLTDKRGAILAGDFLIGLGSAALLVWLSGLRGHLEAAGHGDMLPRAAFAGGVVAAALNLAGAAVGAATVFKAAGLGDQNALFDMGTDLFTIAGAAIAVLFGAASVSGGRTRALPRWASSTGMVVAVLQAVSCVGIFAQRVLRLRRRVRVHRVRPRRRLGRRGERRPASRRRDPAGDRDVTLVDEERLRGPREGARSLLDTPCQLTAVDLGLAALVHIGSFGRRGADHTKVRRSSLSRPGRMAGSLVPAYLCTGRNKARLTPITSRHIVRQCPA